jgi:hypothetical protein
MVLILSCGLRVIWEHLGESSLSTIDSIIASIFKESAMNIKIHIFTSGMCPGKRDLPGRGSENENTFPISQFYKGIR